MTKRISDKDSEKSILDYLTERERFVTKNKLYTNLKLSHYKINITLRRLRKEKILTIYRKKYWGII